MYNASKIITLHLVKVSLSHHEEVSSTIVFDISAPDGGLGTGPLHNHLMKYLIYSYKSRLDTIISQLEKK